MRENFLKISIALLCLGGLWTGRDPGRWEPIELCTDRPIRARLRVRPGPGPGPAVVVLQGYYLRQEFLEDAALALYSSGLSVATVDLNRSRRPEEAIRALLDHLRRDPRLDPERLVLFAHSGSVTPSLRVLQQDSRLRGAVLLGFYPEPYRGRRPNNVLLAFGFFDDYITPEDMLGSLALTTDGPTPEKSEEVVGDFSSGSARRLVRSPLSNHGGEAFDPLLLAASADWYRLALPAQELRRPSPWRALRPPLRAATLAILALLLAPFLRWPWLGVAGFGLLSLAGFPDALWGAVALMLRQVGRKARRHLLALVAAVGSAIVLSWFAQVRGGNFFEWLAASAMYAFSYLPSQVHGLVLSHRGSWKYLVFLACLAGISVWLGRPKLQRRERACPGGDREETS
ncbi:MAG: hypothetical protein HY319_06230 [Armatimonadetes bacterium]|nr:hypothetical protein [Armatimonadota bacterium]